MLKTHPPKNELFLSLQQQHLESIEADLFLNIGTSSDRESVIGEGVGEIKM